VQRDYDENSKVSATCPDGHLEWNSDGGYSAAERLT
jgi:hypothetical protein